ncbi:hypothetical protein PAXRUDRAFT_267779 [Paxillus rubicundulus Ve08.2h10]|uniref:HAT C-terminal dimerisation domain-containing protein n=1 Tax=Paxillus rubicundulus Ve08.2h10 TaxID=930991 RepID=A0A0D0DT78_9AGAM|nr:hypothetical protein PAXRUDRAFT_267779 [Paxillus rubicundulus Ve08.2h10]
MKNCTRSPCHLRGLQLYRSTPNSIHLTVLSVTANSASCERLFSTFGSTLTKLCNPLGANTLQALAEQKMHIWDQQIQQGMKHIRRRLAG